MFGSLATSEVGKFGTYFRKDEASTTNLILKLFILDMADDEVLSCFWIGLFIF